MPQVRLRERPPRRSGGWAGRLNHWTHRNRPKIAVIAAFAVACAIGLAAASAGMRALGPGSATAAGVTPAAR